MSWRYSSRGDSWLQRSGQSRHRTGPEERGDIVVKESSTVFELAVLGLLAEVPHARLRAAQAAQRDPRPVPRLQLRLAVPDAAPAAGRRAHRHRGPGRRRRRGAAVAPGGPGSPTGSPRRARNGSPTCSATPARSPGRTTASACTWRSSPAPRPRRGCASSRAAGGGSRSGGRACGPPSTRAAERLDTYTAELHQLGLEASDREVRWLNELIDAGTQPDCRPDPTATTRPAATGRTRAHPDLTRPRPTQTTSPTARTPPSHGDRPGSGVDITRRNHMGTNPATPSAPPSSASATARRPSSRASSTTRTPSPAPRSPA